ncbi:unnamed protein product [Vitrella brassicaformis CCMP3155]|uniref:Uncharacterized protein n=2 Tax=Vitrella brassicaformis TaxID=1169539 RepID=A0A0G4E9Z9_VITBC|nr:unnamed protein product [Vitrella brassicaformis CCMP3155]|mmetsp:Transcript_37529/g.94143  ORF Transcript_37529/g.94143 Transcript_37529/m.94143 type:complete len:295 (+) Transcript_37529:91-975(+)|eukprot:CEL92755.1 unnamed protein product [Vitrella brassicaformis CCMP3155]
MATPRQQPLCTFSQGLLLLFVIALLTLSHAQPLTLSETPEGDALALFYGKSSLGIDDDRSDDVASWTVKAAEADDTQQAATSANAAIGSLQFESINWHPQKADIHMTVLPSWSQYDPEAGCFVYRVEALDDQGGVIKESNVVRSRACSGGDGTIDGARAHELLLTAAGEEDDYVLPMGGADDLDAYGSDDADLEGGSDVTVAPESASSNNNEAWVDEEQVQSLRRRWEEHTEVEVVAEKERTTAPAAEHTEDADSDSESGQDDGHEKKDTRDASRKIFPDCSPAEPFCGRVRVL